MASAPIAQHSAERLPMSTPELLLRILAGMPVAFVCYLVALAGAPIALVIPGVRTQAYYDAVMKVPERIFQVHRI